MKKIALIPARFDSTRFPGKMMALLDGMTVIRRTYNAAKDMNLFDMVYVVTDSDIIHNEIISHNGNSLLIKTKHNTGSDRIAEAASKIDADIIVNIQGDEPFIAKEPIKLLLSAFNDNNVECASLVQELHDEKLINDPNYVKVVMDINGFALYFSRAAIPYNRDMNSKVLYYEHIGVYGFKKELLIKFSSLKQTSLEETEKIEPLRLLENGIKIKMLVTEYMGIEIDTPEDIIKASEYLKLLKR